MYLEFFLQGMARAFAMHACLGYLINLIKKTCSIVIVITPLIAIMIDQVYVYESCWVYDLEQVATLTSRGLPTVCVIDDSNEEIKEEFKKAISSWYSFLQKFS